MVLGLVVVVLVILTALPLRDYLAQRAQISELQQQQAEARRSVAALEEERRRLQDPAYVAAEARRRLHFVLPGETAYVLVDAPPPVAAAQPDSERAPDGPWFSQLWGSVREADRPSSP